MRMSLRIGLFMVLITTLITQVVFAQTASVITGSGTETNVYFTGDSTSPKTWYQDAMDGNPDLGLKICDVGQQYVGGAYAINVNGQWKSVLITYRSSSDALALADVDDGGGCYHTTPGYLTFSPSYLGTPNPDVYYAAFPGYVWITYASSANPGSLTNFIRTNQMLLGSYDVTRSFSQSTGKVTVNEPTITFRSQAQQIQKPASDATFGITDQRRMVVGICEDQYGATCSDGDVISDPTTFPLYLDPGASPIDDQHTYTRYVVINGIGGQMCIGANLRVTLDSVQPNPIYYSQILNITYTVENHRDTPYEIHGGNVDVTSGFDVEVKIYQQGNPSNMPFDQTYHFTSLPVGSTITRTVTWNATAHSGTYVVEVTVDSSGNIAECNENDNTATQTFELKPIILPTFYINGNKTIVFPHPGVPYNVSIHLKNSDGDNVSNATVVLTERNGVAPFIPLQIWNATLASGQPEERVATKTIVETKFKTDYLGNAELTIIPSGNPVYAPQYSYLDPESLIGNYSIVLTGNASNGEPFVFVRQGIVYHEYALTLENVYDYSFDYNENNTVAFPNRSSLVDMVMNTIYSIFSKFWKAVTL